MVTTSKPSANETLVDLYIERAIDLLRLEAGTRNKVLAILANLEGELVAALAKVDPTGVSQVSAQRKRLTKLLEAVQAAIRASYRDASKLMAAEIREIIDQESVWTGHAINTSIDIEFVTGGLTRQGIANLASDVLIQGAASADWWSRQAQGLQNRFADEMRKGIALGETNADLIGRVRGRQGQPGIMDASEAAAERLVRSSVQAAANVGREAMYAENNDIIASLQWHATLDTRTSTWCITRDGHHYSNTEEHKPKDGGPPWLQGPGKIHWNALVEGTLIKTARGQIPIEDVRVGDLVLTHTGKWSTVSACRAKYLENGLVRVLHTDSGRVLRATYDHPVSDASGAWVFVGALEVGDYLLSDPECMFEVSDVERLIGAKSQNRPAPIDQSQVAVQRTLQFVAPDVDFEGDLERGYREVEHRCFEMILRNPSVIECDQSIVHHLFATADALQKVGRNRLGDFLTLLVGDNATAHPRAHALPKAGLFFGFGHLCDHVRSLAGVVSDHLLGLRSVFSASFLGQPERPMAFASRSDALTGSEIEHGLFFFGSNGDAADHSKARKNAVGQIMEALDTTQRVSVFQVLDANKGLVIGNVFRHEQIIALDMSIVNINVYDLEVDGDASYVANGVVVSNCRSTSIPVLKTWRDLGIDMDEIPQTTRASMDGQVPARQSFEEWLRKQSAARQDTVLGATVADLWRRGKLSFRDLLDQSGRPLTTEQLREKAARRK